MRKAIREATARLRRPPHFGATALLAALRKRDMAPKSAKGRVTAAVVTALAGLLVFLALVAPRDVNQLGPAAFLRIPVEGLLGVALLLALPARTRRAAAAAGGALIGVLVLLKLFDMGFLAVLARPFDPVLDWVLLGNAQEFLSDSYGSTGALGATVAVVVLAVAVLAVLVWAVLHVTRLLEGHRTAALRAVAVLAVAWLAAFAIVGRDGGPIPVAARSTATLAVEKARQVPASLRDEREFTAQAKIDAFRGVPPDQMLTALRGKDVVVAFVESYGRSAVEDPQFAPQVTGVLDAGAARLGAAGFAARSGWLTSPVTGGGSWMAHATFYSGLRIDNEQRYRSLVASDRLTLTQAFRRASWETAALMPATDRAWPEGEFFGFDRVHDARTLGYRGPTFSWSPMPDQYVLSALERMERGRPDRGPLMAELALTSSHVPWTPTPRLVDWDAVGDGSVFAPMVVDAPPYDDSRSRLDYRTSIEYSLTSVLSYAETYGDDDLVLVLLGDHQPAPIITGENASHDVPITIVSRDRAVLDRISPWGWADGYTPGPQTPVWPMEAFRDRFLTAFGPPAAPTR